MREVDPEGQLEPFRRQIEPVRHLRGSEDQLVPVGHLRALPAIPDEASLPPPPPPLPQSSIKVAVENDRSALLTEIVETYRRNHPNDC